VNAGATSVLFLAPGPIGPDVTSPTRRAVKLAEAVGEHCQVTLAAPSPSRFPEGPYRVLETGPAHEQRLGPALAAHDVVVTQTMPSPRQLLGAIRHARRLVVDVVAPLALEASETADANPARRQAITRWRARQLVAHLAAADLVLCTNEKQRDLLTGTALGAGLMALDGRRGSVEADRILVVPQGIDEQPPRHTRTVLRGNGSIGADDRLVLWAGGTWGWMDPLTPVKAIERVHARRPEVKLVFVGTAHPDPAVRRAYGAGTREVMDYARDRGLDGDGVVFSHGWLSYDDYLNALLESDVGIATARPTLESRFASRARVIDYLAAGLPVVCTANDVMSEFVGTSGLGRVVKPLDVTACAEAIDELTASGGARIDDRSALAPLHWRHVARPLVEYCLDPPGERRGRRAAPLAAVAREYSAFARAVYREGSRADFARALLRRVSRRA
jgi:glycosyltransferase involved in cell wall biosynthesis